MPRDALDWPECRHPPCSNAGRYTSGYCGIHDIEYNGGRGTLAAPPSRLWCAHCGTQLDLLGQTWYSQVPGEGDLCSTCQKVWTAGREGC